MEETEVVVTDHKAFLFTYSLFLFLVSTARIYQP